MAGQKEIIVLSIYWIIFFWKFLKNPYLLCTSELASTYFPHWIWRGRQLRKFKFPLTDEIYYRYPACIPFLSTFYPPNFLTAWLATFLELDQAFRLFTWLILGHYLVGSFVAYWMFSQWASPLVSLFGAISLTYCGYNIKPQTPASAFTCCWIPALFIKGWFGVVAFGLTMLAGYYPPLVYVALLAVIKNPQLLLGILIGLPQVFYFCWYWPKSIRSGQKEDRKLGRVPLYKFLEVIIAQEKVAPTNGVHYPEMAMYLGLVPFFIWHLSWWWVPAAIAILICVGVLPQMQRIPARALYLLHLCLCMISLPKISSLHNHFALASLIGLQLLFLLKNSEIYPSFPFSQWWNKPSELYKKYPDDATWPNFSGYLTERRNMWYAGAMRLKTQHA